MNKSLLFALLAISAIAFSVTMTDVIIGVGGTNTSIILEPVWIESITVQSITNYITSVLVYPANNSVFGPNQCSVQVDYETNYSVMSGASTTECRIYGWDGIAPENYTLNQTTYGDFGNSSVTFNITPSDIQFFQINCTASTLDGALSNYTQTVDIQIIGQSFCEQELFDKSGSEGTVIFLGMIIVILAGWFLRKIEFGQASIMLIFLSLGAISHGIIQSSNQDADNLLRYLWVIYILGFFAWFGFLFYNWIFDIMRRLTRKGY